MSSLKCGNCSCADQSQCMKNGNEYVFDIIETQSYVEDHVVMDAENDGQCKCGNSCRCINCTCGSH